MELKIGNITFKNPVTISSGCGGYGYELQEFVDISVYGAIFLKGLTLYPQIGNKPPRIIETKNGIINSIGLENPGFDYFYKNILPKIPTKTNIIQNISGNSTQEYITLAQRLNSIKKINGIEINISCPNVKKGGINIANDINEVKHLIAGIRKVYSKFIAVKLSPDTPYIVEMARICEGEGANSIAVINTLKTIVIKNKNILLSNIYGGYSSPDLKYLGMRIVYDISKYINIPIIGQGGITSYEDAINYIEAGASLVGIGSYNLIEPIKTWEIAKAFQNKNE